jgi:hypothetical protein
VRVRNGDRLESPDVLDISVILSPAARRRS